MAHNFNKTNSLGGLNSDDEVRALPQGDYLFGKNIQNSITKANKGGTLTNVLGNLPITKYDCPYNGGSFPSGKNKCIGAVEDTVYGGAIYFVYNSEGKHGIYRYWSNKTDPSNPYGVVEQVIQYDFGWKKKQRITSMNIAYGNTEAGGEGQELTGDLLYWCDPVPHKINLTKANVVDRVKCWDAYLPKTIDGAIWSSFNLTAKDFNGNVLYMKNLTASDFHSGSGLSMEIYVTQAFVVPGFPGYAWTYHINIYGTDLDLSGVTSIQISGSNFPENNRSWGIHSYTNGGFTSIVTDTVIFGNTPSTPLAHVDIFGSGGFGYYTPTDVREDVIKSIANQINGDPLNNTLVAEYCDCKLEFCEKVAGTVWTLETDNPQILLPAKNWYGATLIDRDFDRCKWLPDNSPKGEFRKDPNYEPNYVQKKVFQFRLQYIYDDFEQSSLGVWSQIPINNLACDGTSNPEYNYINVNFEDDLIANAQTLVLLKKVRFIARELNTGNDRAVIDLEPCDFLDYDLANNKWVCSFDFYNDIIANTVDPVLAAKLFDNVPLESNAEEFVKNRMIEGGCLRGYDAPACIDAKPQMEFVELPNPKLHKVSGRILVLSYGTEFYTNIDADVQTFYSLIPQGDVTYTGGGGGVNSRYIYPYWSPAFTARSGTGKPRGGIFHDTNNDTNNKYPFFGGSAWGGEHATYKKIYIQNGLGAENPDYDQRIPEGGWPVYAEGTDYFTISRQAYVGLLTDEVGAISVNIDPSYAEIPSLSTFYNHGGNDLYSTFDLYLPDGTYIIRLASHLCSFNKDGEDKLKKGFMYDLSAGRNYQKTSTNVWGVFDVNGNWIKEKEIVVTVNGGDVSIGDFVVMDLVPIPGSAPARDGDLWQPITGYLYDDTASPLGQANADMNSQSYSGVPIEKALVNYGAGLGNRNWSDVAITDHNGYFFGIACKANQQYNEYAIYSYQVGNGAPTEMISGYNRLWLGSLTKLFTKELSPVDFNGAASSGTPSNVGQISCCITTTNPNSRQRSSTIIQGQITDSAGSPVSGVTILYTNGGNTGTSITGNYDLIAWGDMVTPNLGQFSLTSYNIQTSNNRVVDYIIFNLDIFCSPDYINGRTLPISIDPFGDNSTTVAPPYSPTAKKDVGIFIINEGNDPSKKAHKRGGQYSYGIRCYDDAGRLCSVISAFDMYVPFITEDIGKYSIEDFSGVVYPASTYRYGKPTIKWVLGQDTILPTWCKTFQWMRVKNSIYGRYLQWVANKVTYLSAIATSSSPEIQTTFQNIDAVAIKISLSNIVDSYSRNNSSTLSYSFQKGDRLRLIANRYIVNYSPNNFPTLQSSINDYEITSYEADTQSIIISGPGFPPFELQSGMLFEIFNPKSVSTQDEQIYYEVGEVVAVNNGVPNSFSGVFTNGDTYWRGRFALVNDSSGGFAASYPIVIEDASVSDFYPSEAQDIGRIGIIDPAFKQVYSPMLMTCSNPFLPGTAVNGLSSFEALNEKELDRANGAIQRLITVNNTVVAVSNVRETSNYIQVVTLQQASSGEGVLAVSNQYFGTEYPHTKVLGTNLQGSVFVNDGVIFGLHSDRSDVFMYQGDGEQSISDVKMKNYFQQLGYDGVSDAIAVYDRFHEEYVLTVWRKTEEQRTVVSDNPNLILRFNSPNTVEVGQDIDVLIFAGGKWTTYSGTVTNITLSEFGTGNYDVTVDIGTHPALHRGSHVQVIYSSPETVIWFNGNETSNKKRWVSFSDCTPENYCQIASDLITFKDGKIWMQGVNPLRNNFFGVQYSTHITPVFNDQPELFKIWNASVLKTRQSDGKMDWFAPTIANNNNQLSRLVKGSWVKRGEDYFAAFKKNLNDPTVANPIVNGNALRSSTLTCELINDSNAEVVLYEWNANFSLSERTSK